MQATGQNTSPNVVICCQEPAVAMVTQVENPVMTLRPVLLQSINDQFYDNCTIVITQTIVQLIRVQSTLSNILTMCTLKISREKTRYILLRHASIAFKIYYQSGRLTERLS